MKLLNKILLPTDFSKSSENVTKLAIKLAKTFDAEIILLHILPVEAEIDSIVELLQLAVKTRFGQLTEIITKAGINVADYIVKFGSIYDEIVRIADYKNVNIIVMGSGKNLEKSSHKLSTTTAKVISKTHKPVWVVKDGGKLDIHKILCPVDFSEPSKVALDNAIHLARRFDAEVNIMSVFEPIDVYTDELDFICEHNDQLLEDYFVKFDEFLHEFNLKNIKARKTHKSGKPYASILMTIGRYKPDLLIMGTTGKTGLSKILIGSVTEKVIREVPCSFITTKSENIIKLQLESKIKDIEFHCNSGKELLNDGYIDEALEQFHICLDINNMYVPALYGLANVYDHKGESSKAKMFRTFASDVINRIYDTRAENQIRKHYTI